MNMKKLLAMLLALAMALAAAACTSAPAKEEPSAGAAAQTGQAAVETASAGKTSDAEPVVLIVFAAASLTETLTAIADRFMEQDPAVTVQFSFDSSGTLKTQIQEGADCDVFISAGQKQMDQLDADTPADANPDGLDLILKGSRFNILENRVALVVPEDHEKDIRSFADMAAGLKSGSILLAMGNSDVPVGQYAQKILRFYGLDEEALAAAGCITYGSNVKEVAAQVCEAVVDCGIVYCTDAFAAGLTIADYASAEMCGQVVYPAAILSGSKNIETAQAFLDFCRTPEAAAIFAAAGFTAL